MYRSRNTRALASASLLFAVTTIVATVSGQTAAASSSPLSQPDGPTAAITRNSVATTEPQPPSVIGTYKGTQFRLADGWGDAHACSSNGVTARCYGSEAEMDDAEGPLLGRAPLAECALPAVRLYPSTSFGGGVLQLTTRDTLIDLATHGFNNVTSSYRIGACDAYFYDTTSGGTGYPGTTAAWSSASAMTSGWDNRVGSVYID